MPFPKRCGKLTTLVDQCNQDKRVKVIVFRSTVPESFSAGADIQEFQTLRRTPSDVMKFNEITDRLEKKIADGLKPTIAMIQGFCIGGGCEIAVACDFRFSDQSGNSELHRRNLALFIVPQQRNV